MTDQERIAELAEEIAQATVAGKVSSKSLAIWLDEKGYTRPAEPHCKYEDWDDTTLPHPTCHCLKREGIDCVNGNDVAQCPDYEPFVSEPSPDRVEAIAKIICNYPDNGMPCVGCFIKAREILALSPVQEPTKQWIGVEDELPRGQWNSNHPHLSEEVLIANSCSISIGYYNRNDSTWYVGEPATPEWIDKITHWMPLPINPHDQDTLKEVKNERI